MYGWGYSGYNNPYAAGYAGSGATQPSNADAPPQGGSPATAYNYTQPLSTTSPAPP